ncbi:tRNA modification GTPase [Candidatus Vidania fulgoroideae]|nr:tRNA modification GTPase [Candidatus Vidania fulgoroideae]
MYRPIVAISTCNEKDSSIGIIRISSGKNKLIIKYIIKKFLNKDFLFPRLATYSKIFIKKNEIDDGIVIFFPKNKSYTGEDMLEMQLHGSVYIIKKIFRELLKNGIRKAKRGEFTLRAIKNKKMNFFDVERLYSLYVLKRNKKKLLSNKTKYKKKFLLFNKKIFKLKLLIENEINFNEKNDNFFPKIKEITKKIIKEIKTFLKKKFFFFKKKIRVSISGKENIGKSTLFNILTKKKRSITSKFPGTTTNYVKENIRIKNEKLRLYDTAGVNRKKNFRKINKINKKIIKKSDIVIKLHEKKKKEKNKKFIINVVNKIDVLNKKNVFEKKDMLISCKFMFGIEKLKKKVYGIIKKIKRKGRSMLKPEIINVFNSLRKVEAFIKKSSCSFPVEILYKKVDELQKKILNIYNFKNKKISREIFKNFCIGK